MGSKGPGFLRCIGDRFRMPNLPRCSHEQPSSALLAPYRLFGRLDLVELREIEALRDRRGFVDYVGQARTPDYVDRLVSIARIDGLRKHFVDAGQRYREVRVGFENFLGGGAVERAAGLNRVNRGP